MINSIILACAAMCATPSAGCGHNVGADSAAAVAPDPAPAMLAGNSGAHARWGGASRAWRGDFTYAGVPALAAGLLLSATEKDYRRSSGHFIHHSNSLFDNASQYAPLAVTAILKACGAETRSNWGRLATGSALSTVIMAGLTQGLKHTVDEMRPDRSDSRSFPSGHTALSFMCATIMSKELGWKSPWYSVGAYTLASATAMIRVTRNHHWVNDVVFGAGIGITSVDLGYFITDLIFKNRGINPRSVSGFDNFDWSRPSFFGVGMAAGTATCLRLPSAVGMSLKMGATASTRLEGAMFFNSHWGVGGQLGVTAAPVTPTADSAVESAPMAVIAAEAGGYWSTPLNRRLRLGARLLAGLRHSPSLDLHYLESDDNGSETTGPTALSISSATSPSLTTGVSLAYALKPHTALRIYCDYSFSAPLYRFTPAGETSAVSLRTPVNALSVGMSIATIF